MYHSTDSQKTTRETIILYIIITDHKSAPMAARLPVPLRRPRPGGGALQLL